MSDSPIADFSGNPRYGSQRHHRRHGSARRGRLWLVLIFFGNLGIDALVYVTMPDESRHYLFAPLINNTIWTIALLAGMWFRKRWCRVTLILLWVAGSAFTLMLFIANLASAQITHPAVVFGGAAAMVIRLFMIWALIASPDIKRLTKPRDEWGILP